MSKTKLQALQAIKKLKLKLAALGFLLFMIIIWSLFFASGLSFKQFVLALTGDYNKPVNGTLTASDWNNLVNDFGQGKPLVVHTLSSSLPSLSSTNFELLWTGYSLAGTFLSSGYDFDKDLNSPDSCAPFFIPLPVIECGSPDTCDFYTLGDYSMWLTSGMTVDEGPVSGVSNILPKIGRCAVYLPKRPVIIKHDQTVMGPSAQVPAPSGWTRVYDGYTLMGSTLSTGYVGAIGGACLQNFVPLPIIECGGFSSDGCDFYTASDFGGWATGLFVDEGPVSGVSNILPKIGRCAVFIKN